MACVPELAAAINASDALDELGRLAAQGVVVRNVNAIGVARRDARRRDRAVRSGASEMLSRRAMTAAAG